MHLINLRTTTHCSLFMHENATNENANLIPPCCAAMKPNVFQITPEKKCEPNVKHIEASQQG